MTEHAALGYKTPTSIRFVVTLRKINTIREDLVKHLRRIKHW